MKINIVVWDGEENSYYPLDKQLSPLDFVDAKRIGFVVKDGGEVLYRCDTLDEAQRAVELEGDILMGREVLIQYLKTTTDIVKLRRIAVFESSKAYFGKDKCNTDVYGSCVYYPMNGLEGCVVGRLLTPEYIAELNGNPNAEYLDLPLYLEPLGNDFLEKLQKWHDNLYYRPKMEVEIRKEYL